MLSTPKYGWVDLSICDWKDRASYLTDVPNNLLDSLIFSFESRNPASVSFDAEGWEYIIVFDWNITYIIESQDNNELICIDRGLISLANEIYNDISKDIDEWAKWDYDIDFSDKDKESYSYMKWEEGKNNLKKKLEKLKNLIESEEDRKRNHNLKYVEIEKE